LQNVIERPVIHCDGETFAVDETQFQKEKPGMLTEMLVDRKREAIEAALIQGKGRISGPSGPPRRSGFHESTIRTLGIRKHHFRDQ
jgi:transcriptional regulator of acetoin/glycerol metabolism